MHLKKYALLALLAAGSQAARAQDIAAGTIAAGGSVGYNKTTSKSTNNSNSGTTETTTSQFSFTPSVGYFVIDNLEVGISAGYTAYRRPYSTNTSATNVRAELDPTTNLRIGPYVRYYKMFTEQFGVSGTLSGGYQSNRNHEYNGNNIVDFKGSGYYAALTPAIVFFPVPKFAISASIGSLAFSHISYDYPSGPGITAPAGYNNESNTFGANFGFDQLQFGGTYYFGR